MNEEAKKALHYSGPFIFSKDYEDTKEGRFGIVGARIRKRGWILLLVSVIISLVFFLNGMSAAVVWFEHPDTRHLVSLTLWTVVAAFALMYGVRHFLRLSKTGAWFVEKGSGEGS